MTFTKCFSDGVYRAEKHTGANMAVMSEGITNRPMGINVYSDKRQKCKFPVGARALGNIVFSNL